ncbi:MAG: potassium channel family protein [Oscillibacter sp.]|nr:potassium channel family protein [Oscillibacter sp.]
MRERIFEIIEVAEDYDRASAVYDITMMASILLSLVPLAFKQSTTLFVFMDQAAACIFALDYLARLSLADLKLKRGAASFALYPFTPMAIVDMLAFLPTVTAVSAGFRLVRLLRLIRTFRVFKMFRYSRSIQLIAGVIRDQRAPLIAVCTLAVSYVLVVALIIFNVEPDTFDSFFDAVYWATISLTTVGYGDIHPVTVTGRLVTIVSSLMGIAVVALPSSIITGGYMAKLRQEEREKEEREREEGKDPP